MNKLLIFLLGVGIGTVSASYFCKKKYEKIANEEITEIRNFYKDKNKCSDDAKNPVKPDISEYLNIIQKNNYSNNECNKKNVYIIEPEEFGMDDEYEQIELTLYANGYLVDDIGDPMDKSDIENHIGYGNLSKMGMYESDALHVRNDILKVEYEILSVLDDYEESEEE